MKAKKVCNFLIGISAVSLLVGLGFLGVATGFYLKTHSPINTHVLFNPAIECIGAGLVFIMLLAIINSGKKEVVE